jgi:alcohol dehydrogenase
VAESDSPALAGKRVVGEINLSCTNCGWCRRGLGRHCPRRSVLGMMSHPGTFQEYFILPERNLHVLPDAIPTDHAVFAEPVAAACEILDQVSIPRLGRVAVLGDGKLGLLIAQVLHIHGARVRLFGRHASKLAIAASAGIETVISPKRSPEATYHWVVEATGSADGLRQAVAMTSPRGIIVMKSTVHGAVTLDMAPVVVGEITLIGSRCGRFEPALNLLAEGRLKLDEMISDRFPLAEASRALARAAEPGVLKVLLDA